VLNREYTTPQLSFSSSAVQIIALLLWRSAHLRAVGCYAGRVRLASICTILFILASCSKPVSQNGKSVRLAVGGQSQLVYLPATLAHELNHYQEVGLDVTISDFQGGAKALEALLGGSADVVCGFFDHVIQMQAEGRKLKSFVTMQQLLGLALVASPGTKRKVSSIADLKGAVVGVSSPGSSTDLFLKYLLSQNGVAPSDVSTVAVGMSAGAIASMERGKVDAAVMAEPAIATLSRRAGMLHILADTRNAEGVKKIFGIEHYPAAVFYSTHDWLAKNPQTAAALARAIRKTLEALHANPQLAATKMPAAFQGEEPGLYALSVLRALPMYTKDGRMPEDGPALVQKVLSVSLPKVRDAKIDLKETFTNEWLQ
jgi:NitT/TauT family transport system substrate-binding protein